MRVKAWVDVHEEVDVNITGEQIAAALYEDPSARHTVLDGINNFACFMKAVPVEVIESIEEDSRKVIADFLVDQSRKFSGACGGER